MPQGQRVAPARRTKLGDDGNLMQADGNSFPVFILGWTIGAMARPELTGLDSLGTDDQVFGGSSSNSDRISSRALSTPKACRLAFLKMLSITSNPPFEFTPREIFRVSF